MSTRRYIVEPLGRQHRRATFSCGNETLDHYFRQQAEQDQRRRVAVVFVALDTQAPGTIVGFYILSTASVEAAALPEEIAGALPRYPHLPAILLGRLARDERWKGQGIGELLLADALQRSLRVREEIGALFVIVDAIDAHAVIFYERFGFRRFPEQPGQLFLPLAGLQRDAAE